MSHQVFKSYEQEVLSAVSRGHDATVLVLGRHGGGKSHTLFGQHVTSLSGRYPHHLTFGESTPLKIASEQEYTIDQKTREAPQLMMPCLAACVVGRSVGAQ